MKQAGNISGDHDGSMAGANYPQTQSLTGSLNADLALHKV
jgi:hypothetical protein